MFHEFWRISRKLYKVPRVSTNFPNFYKSQLSLVLVHWTSTNLIELLQNVLHFYVGHWNSMSFFKLYWLSTKFATHLESLLNFWRSLKFCDVSRRSKKFLEDLQQKCHMKISNFNWCSFLEQHKQHLEQVPHTGIFGDSFFFYHQSIPNFFDCSRTSEKYSARASLGTISLISKSEIGSTRAFLGPISSGINFKPFLEDIRCWYIGILETNSLN